MRIVTYCITFPEEFDVLPNMIEQAMKLGDVWLFDGGRINSHYMASNFSPVSEYVVREIAERYGCKYSFMPWPGTPGVQRNRALEQIDQAGYDWVIQQDSDELWTDQAVATLPTFLDHCEHASNILVKMLHLVQDEDHYWKKNFTHLVHGRIFRPGTVRYSDGWHEHQEFDGLRIRSDFVMVHTKHLSEERLHRFYGRGIDMWADMDITPLPGYRFGLTWPSISFRM